MELIGLFILILAVLVALMVWLSPRRRRIAFLLGLVFAWDLAMLGRFEASELFLLAPAGLLVSFTAMLVEVPAFLLRMLRKSGAAAGPGGEPGA